MLKSRKSHLSQIINQHQFSLHCTYCYVTVKDASDNTEATLMPIMLKKRLKMTRKSLVSTRNLLPVARTRLYIPLSDIMDRLESKVLKQSTSELKRLAWPTRLSTFSYTWIRKLPWCNSSDDNLCRTLQWSQQ